jgi:hypothetical protein
MTVNRSNMNVEIGLNGYCKNDEKPEMFEKKSTVSRCIYDNFTKTK